MRRGSIAGARALNAAFFLAVSAYGFLSYSPFAYQQFIKPNVVPALTAFVTMSPWLFWIALLISVLTLMPQLRGARGCGLARAYVAVSAVVGIAVVLRPPLETLGSSGQSFAVGLLALAAPVWLAVLDHRVWSGADIRRLDRLRASIVSGVSAVAVWAIYAGAVPLRMREVAGLDLTPRALLLGASLSLAADLLVFATLWLALLSITWLAAARRGARPSAERMSCGGATEYWWLVLLLAAGGTSVIYTMVCASIAFTGGYAAIASASIGITFALVWAGLARLRGGASADPVDPLTLFAAPIAGTSSPIVAVVWLVALAFIAFALNAGVSHFDWSFLLQKLGVLAVWLAVFAAVSAALPSSSRATAWRTTAVLRSAAMSAILMIASVGFALRQPSASSIVDRYAAVDPSFRLIRDAGTTRSAATVEYYAQLRSHTLLASGAIPPVDIDLVRPLAAVARDQRPDIFLFIIDSLRRDYVSPYNPRVTFTPEIGKLANDSLVFQRAFTRYSGTALAVPSIWAGGLVVHALDQPAFARRNTLLKLLNANGYVRMMSLDHITRELVPPDALLDELDRGTGTMDVDLCGTLDELDGKLGPRSTAPVFFSSLPQNVHIAVATRRAVPDEESYPGFFAPVASSLRRLDRCIGRFVDRLKASGRYDNSVIIVTADHGDALGEEGRWGHAYFVSPEVMRVPLIVHLPQRMKASLTADAAAVTFTTDIAPSLYALLGYEPADLGALFGRPLFVRPDAAASASVWRRQQPFLLASSYGAVYALLRDNGGRMYGVDAVDGRDYAFDSSTGLLNRHVGVTQSMTDDNRREILEQLSTLAATYRYQPRR